MAFWICDRDWDLLDEDDVFETEDEAVEQAVQTYRFADVPFCLIVQVEERPPAGTLRVCTVIVMGDAVYDRRTD